MVKLRCIERPFHETHRWGIFYFTSEGEPLMESQIEWFDCPVSRNYSFACLIHDGE